MGVVLAIDPGRRQGKALDRLTREMRGHEVVIATSGDEALAVFESRIPDLVLFPLFLAPADEARIQSRLRALTNPGDLQALTIPFKAFFDWERHATRPAAVPPRWYYWFRPSDRSEAEYSDPFEFAEAVRADIDRARAQAAAQVEMPVAPPVLPPPAPTPPPVFQPEPPRFSTPHPLEAPAPSRPIFEQEPKPAPVAWRPASFGVEPDQPAHVNPLIPPRSPIESGPPAFDVRAAFEAAAQSQSEQQVETAPIETEDDGPGRLAGLWSAVSGAAGRVREQLERLPRAAWVGAIAVIIVATLGATGYVTRLVKAPFNWMSATKKEWFPEQAKTGTAEILTVPDGAQVWLNGRQIGVTPLKTEFAVGSHEIELRYRGSSRNLTLDITPGASVVQRIEWAAPKGFGKLRIESEPAGATVVIDGRSAGVAPLTTEDLPIGRHEIELTAGGNTAHESAEVKLGRTTTVRSSVYQGWLALFSPIEMRASVDGRALTLDDQNRALLSAGSHQLTIQNRALGYLSTQTVAITPGQTTPISVVLPKTTLTIMASGPAEVWVDGARIGDAPVVDLPVDIGTRDVVLRSAEHGERRLTVTATVAPVKVVVDLSAPTQ